MNSSRKKNPYIADNLRIVRRMLNLSQKDMADKWASSALHIHATK